MTSSKTAIAAISFLCLPGAALAQEMSGVGTIGYGHSSVSDGGNDLDSFTLDGAGRIDFLNGWTLDGIASFANVDPDGGSHLNVMDLGVEGQYLFYSGAMIGGYLDYASLDGGGLIGEDPDATSYGLTGGYVGQFFRAVANIGITNTSPSVGSSSDWTDYGINLAYTPTERTTIAGHWLTSDIDTDGGDSDLRSFGAGASHDFGYGIMGFGGISHTDFDVADIDATTYGVGVGYDLTQISGVPAQVSLELARTNLDAGPADADVDTVRLGVTIPFGARRAGAPLNSAANSIMAPRHNALSTLYDGLF